MEYGRTGSPGPPEAPAGWNTRLPVMLEPELAVLKSWTAVLKFEPKPPIVDPTAVITRATDSVAVPEPERKRGEPENEPAVKSTVPVTSDAYCKYPPLVMPKLAPPFPQA